MPLSWIAHLRSPNGFYTCNTSTWNFMSLGSRVRVGGWIFAISRPERWYGCRMRVLVRISPIVLFSDRFRVKPYPLKQKKGGENLPIKDSAWACLLGKNGAFLKTPETSFLAITWVSGTLEYAPKAYPVKFYGLECWGWAVVGSDSWDFQKL